MAAVILFAPTPLMLAASQSRGILEASAVPAPAPASTADSSTEVSPALAPGSARVPTSTTPSDSTLEAREKICEGQGNNPASFNFAIGDFSAKVLLDFVYPIEVVPKFQFLLADISIQVRALQGRPGQPPTSFINNLFVDTGNDRILVDSGNGLTQNSTLYEELLANGIEPESITKILLTHGHSDHLGGLVRDAAATILSFPNAKVYMSRIEWAFWTAPYVNMSGVALPPDFQASLIQTAKTVLRAVCSPFHGHHCK
jgi:hypothetical protein